MTFRMSSHMKLGMVKLKVSQLARSLTFYEEVLGFRRFDQPNERTVQLTADGHSPLLELEEVPNVIVTPPRSSSGLYHFALLVPSRQDLGRMLQQLVLHRIPVGHSDHDVSEALYISDPDDNGIEIYRDRPRSEWRYEADHSIVMGGAPLDLPALLAEAEGIPWQGLPTGTIMGHLHFHVSNLDESKAFYCQLLGLDMMVEMKRFRAAFISAGGYHHHFGLNTWAGEGAPILTSQHTGIDYFKMILPHDALQELLKRLDQAGIPIEMKQGAAYCMDPNGIGIKLVAAI